MSAKPKVIFIKNFQIDSASWILYAVLTVTRIAPILVAAQKVMYQAGTLVAQIATLSPAPTPIAISARAKVSTSSRNCG